MSERAAGLRAEVKQTLSKLAKVLGGQSGPNRFCVVRCANPDTMQVALSVIPEAFPKIPWVTTDLSQEGVAVGLRGAMDLLMSGQKAIPILYGFPAEAESKAMSPLDATTLESAARNEELTRYPMVILVLAGSVKVMADYAGTLWRGKGGYVAWPNLRDAVASLSAGSLASGEMQMDGASDVEQVLKRLQGDRAADYLCKAAEVNFSRGRLEEGRDLLSRALQIYSGSANIAGLAKTYHLLGVVAGAMGDTTTAIEWFQQAVDSWGIVENAQGLAETYSRKGQIHFHRGELDKAAEAFHNALQIDEERNESARVAGHLRHMAMVLERLDMFEGAEKMHRRSLDLETSLGNSAGAARALHHLGRIADRQGHFESAIKLYDDSIGLKEELNDKPGLAATYHQLGNAHAEVGEISTSIDYYKRAEAIEMELHDLQGLARTCAQMGLVQKKANLFPEALASLVRAHHYAQKVRSPLANEVVERVREIEAVLSVDVYNRVIREAGESVKSGS